MTNARKGHPTTLTGWTDLTPHGVVAFGPPAAAEDRMLGVQSAIYRTFVFFGRVRLPKIDLLEHSQIEKSEPQST